MKGWSREWIVESWSLHYHVFSYLKKGGNLEEAMRRWNPLRVTYFWNWILNNSETV